MSDLTDLVDLHAAVEASRVDYAEAAGRLHVAVADALDAGTSAADIAEALGVSRVRVYQLRDKASR